MIISPRAYRATLATLAVTAVTAAAVVAAPTAAFADTVTVTTASELQAALNASLDDTIVLGDDILGSESFTVPLTAMIDLDGFEFDASSISLASGAGVTLYVDDSSDDSTGALTVTSTVEYTPAITTTDAALVIVGGTVTATAPSWAPAIGAPQSSSDFGDITVNGGSLIANGGYLAAGIGTTSYGPKTPTGTVTVTGGTVEAHGGWYSAGIGAGYDNGLTPNHVTVTVSGGDVTAVGGFLGAGIGGGRLSTGVTTVITGGTVNATTAGYSGSSGGSGIGGGHDASGGTTTISGGTVVASGRVEGTSGGGGAGIGGAGDPNTPRNKADGGITTVTGGTVTAIGGDLASGIGGGVRGDGGTTTVTGDAVVTAIGGSRASGIGGGMQGAGGTVQIGAGATVTASVVPDSTYESVLGNAVGGAYEGNAGFGTLEVGGTLVVPAGNYVSVNNDATATVTETGVITGEGSLEGSGTVTNGGLLTIATVKARSAVSTGLTITGNSHRISYFANFSGGHTGSLSTTDVYATTLAAVAKSLPADPERASWYFTGWFPNADGSGEQLTTDTVLTANPSYYATWVPTRLVVTTTEPAIAGRPLSITVEGFDPITETSLGDYTDLVYISLSNASDTAAGDSARRAFTFTPGIGALGIEVSLLTDPDIKAYHVVEVAADQFTVTRAPVITGTTSVGSTLTAKASSWKPAGASFSYQWLRDGVEIPSAWESKYTLVGADAGTQITARVHAELYFYAPVDLVSAPVVITPGTMTGPTPEVEGTAAVGAKLTAVPGAWSVSPVTRTYQWVRNGTPIAGATRGSYVVTAADVGARLGYVVTGVKNGYTTLVKSSFITAVVAKGTITAPVPVVSGTATAGHTLTAKPGTWAPSSATRTYTWLRNGVRIVGATTSKYTTTSTDKGKTIRVVVTGTLNGYTTLKQTSAGTTIAK